MAYNSHQGMDNWNTEDMSPANPYQIYYGQPSVYYAQPSVSSLGVLPILRPGNTTFAVNRPTTQENTRLPFLTSFPDRPDIDPSNPFAPVFVGDKVESRIEYVLAGDFGPTNRPSVKRELRWAAHIDVRISRLPHQRRGYINAQTGGTSNDPRSGGASNEGLRQLMAEGFFWSSGTHLIKSFRPLTRSFWPLTNTQVVDSGFDPQQVWGRTYYMSSVVPFLGTGQEPTLEWEMQVKVFEDRTGMDRDWEMVSHEDLTDMILAAKAYNEDDELVYLFDYKNCSQPAFVRERAFRYLVGLTPSHGDDPGLWGHRDEPGTWGRPPPKPHPGSEEWWNGENKGRNFNLVLDPQVPGQEPKGFFPREIGMDI